MKRYESIYEYKLLNYKDYIKLRRVRKWYNTWVVVQPNDIEINKPVEVRRLKENVWHEYKNYDSLHNNRINSSLLLT